MKSLVKLAIVGFLTIILINCAGSNGGSTNGTGDVNQLNILAPNVVLSASSDQQNNAYVVIQNNESIAVTEVNYSISSITGSGNQISVNQASASKCSTISAKNFCILSLNVPSQLPAGSFMLSLGNGNSNLAESSQQIIGVQTMVNNNLAGASGVTLYYSPIVLADIPYIIVSGAVTSPNASIFNQINLTDSRGNKLPNQVSISGNLGINYPNLTTNDVFAIMLPVPATNNGNQVLQVQTVESSTNVESFSQGVISYMLNTQESGGVLSTLPSSISLDYSNPVQNLTLYNSGDAPLTISTINSSSGNVSLSSPAMQTIASGKFVTITLTLVDPTATATTSYLTFSGVSQGRSFNSLVTVYQNISGVTPRPVPSPSPSPTAAPPDPVPTPTPAPPVPRAGLAVNMSSTSFITNTQIGSVSQFVTLINTGNTPESNFEFNFGASQGFSLSSPPLLTGACQVSGNIVTSTLNPIGNNSSCIALLTWNPGSTPLAPQIVIYQIGYDYGYVHTASLIQVLVTANYLATANLILSPNNVYFNSITNNGSSSSESMLLLTNTGDGNATSLTSSIKPINNYPNIFSESTASNQCGNSLNPGGTCNYTIRFGPISNAGSQTENLSTTFEVSYLAYNGAAIDSDDTLLYGTIYESSNVIPSLYGTQGFTSGNGSISSPLVVSLTDYTEEYILNFQLKNDSDVPLDDFFVSLSSQYLGNWKLNKFFTTCPIDVYQQGYNLSKNSSCNVAVQTTFNNAIGLTSFNPMAFIANWRSKSFNQESSQIVGDLVYIDVYQAVNSSLTTPAYGELATIFTPITVQFTASVNNVSTSTVSVFPYNNMVPIPMTMVSSTESSYTFQPSSPLIPGIAYLVRTSSAITDQNGNPVPENTMEFNTENEVVNWTQLTTPTPVLIATVAPDGTLFYSDENGYVYMQQTNGSFTHVANFHKTKANLDPGITTLSAGYFPNQTPSPYTIFVGTGTGEINNDNKMYQYIIGDGSNVVTLADLNWDDSLVARSNWPTASVFSSPTNNLAGGYIYYGDVYGDFFYNTQVFPPNPFGDMENSWAVYSVVVAPNPLTNTMYFYAISHYETIFTDDYPHLRQLWACNPYAKDECTVIAGYYGAGMLATDSNGSLYAGWYDGSVYKYSLNTLESTAFVVGSNITAPHGDVNTQVSWDNAHNQLLVYNFYPTPSITAYNSSGATVPLITNTLPSNGEGVKQIKPDSYNYRNTTTLIPNGNGPVGSNNTIYFLTESGELYYVAY